MPTWHELDEKIRTLVSFFTENGVVYAFGGAIGLAYYGEPRSTIDIDANVFVDAESAPLVLERMRALGVQVSEEDVAIAKDIGQVRLLWDATLLDLFFMNHPFHEECRSHVRSVPFGDVMIDILGIEDLLIFKIAFDRRKDWLDLEQVLFARKVDLGYLRRWVREFFGEEDARVAELERTVGKVLGPDA